MFFEPLASRHPASGFVGEARLRALSESEHLTILDQPIDSEPLTEFEEVDVARLLQRLGEPASEIGELDEAGLRRRLETRLAAAEPPQ